MVGLGRFREDLWRVLEKAQDANTRKRMDFKVTLPKKWHLPSIHFTPKTALDQATCQIQGKDTYRL